MAFDFTDVLKGMKTLDEQEQIEYISLDLIDPDDRNFYSLDGIEELADNIELIGLQQPMRVRSGMNGHVTLVSGHRRRAACLLIRDRGNPMFDRGAPCIRDRGDVSREMQELRLIFANSSTRVMSAPELSMQAEKTQALLEKLEAQGMKLPGRMRDHVAAIVNTSRSRIGRLHAIRARLTPALLEEFDAGRLGETVAYRLSQEEPDVQSDLAAKLGPAVRGLTLDTAEKVIDQVKRPIVMKEPEPEPDAGKSLDALKKYLEDRSKEDRKFWKLMQEAADDLIMHSFHSGAAMLRKDNIDTLRLDCRNCGVGGYAADWSGSNKGIALGYGQKIARTWTEVYDTLAAIAITRWRQTLSDERNRRNVKLKNVPTVDTKPAWQTGNPPTPGWYCCWAKWNPDGGNWDPDHETLYWNGAWFEDGLAAERADTADYRVFSWYPVPAPPEEG